MLVPIVRTSSPMRAFHEPEVTREKYQTIQYANSRERDHASPPRRPAPVARG